MTYTSFTELQSAEDDFESAEPLDSRIRTAAVPLMAIFGTEDQIWNNPSPQAAANAYRSVPGAEISMIKGAGHSPNVEKPAQTAALINEFAANAGDETGGKGAAPDRARGKHNNVGKGAASACKPPAVRRIRTQIAAPKAGAAVGSSFLLHVLSSPSRCQATVTLTVDGSPYRIGLPEDKHRPPGVTNPISTKALHLTGRRARQRYERVPRLPVGPLPLLQAGRPEGTPHRARLPAARRRRAARQPSPRRCT